MKLIKDYDCTNAYHPETANVVANALRRKSPSSNKRGRIPLLRELKGFMVVLNTRSTRNLKAHF